MAAKAKIEILEADVKKLGLKLRDLKLEAGKQQPIV